MRKGITVQRLGYMGIVVLIACGGSVAVAAEGLPEIVSVGMAAPRMLEVTIDAQQVVPSKLIPYVAQPGDQVKDGKLSRGGKEIGLLLGAKQDWLRINEQMAGEPLKQDLAAQAATWSITSKDDPGFAAAVRPDAVYRKTTPTDWCLSGNREFPLRHRVYLVLPRDLTDGKTYTLSCGGLNVKTPTVTWKQDTSRAWCEALHIQQIGYRTDDPVKRAYLSLWMGTGGGCSYPDGMTFRVVDDASGEKAFAGKVEIAWRAKDPERLQHEANFNLTDVWRMDFGALTKAGRYRVVVDGLGCSWAFTIGGNPWETALLTVFKGLYNERSGVELGPPYADFRRPACLRPDGGTKVTQSSYAIADGDLGSLVKGDTGVPVPEAWGAYQDAGDWNPRRANHMRVTMAMLELCELYPDYFLKLPMKVPKQFGVPPILEECLFELDLFRRLQRPDGGVSFGIETEGDPPPDEVSWLQTKPEYVWAADCVGSWWYAAVAARTSRVLAKIKPKLADDLASSAKRAMAFAETDYADRKAAGKAGKIAWDLLDARPMAALEMLALTRDRHWHEVAMENLCLAKANPDPAQWGTHWQMDQVFRYARLDPKLADPERQAAARRWVVEIADRALAVQAGNAFNCTNFDRWRPLYYGFYPMPNAQELGEAHWLTGDAKYLAGAVQATHFPLGCNPGNIVYTTGLGINPIKHPLHLDSRNTGQAAPAGLTTYGNVDFWEHKDDGGLWPMKWYLGKVCVPGAWEWPISEAYWDISLFPMMTEFTVDAWAGNVWLWGYLAARR